MGNNKWSGWIAFAGWLMVIVGVLDFFEGLIAVIRGQYYVLTANQIIVFDIKTWGWITMIWGVVVLLAGLSLLSGAAWARWFTISSRPSASSASSGSSAARSTRCGRSPSSC